MAEPLEYLALGEAIVFAGESLGLIGTAAELTEGAIITESVSYTHLTLPTKA